jgi:hypothetical protein
MIKHKHHIIPKHSGGDYIKGRNPKYSQGNINNLKQYRK